MGDDEKKPFVRLEDTKASTTDDEGHSRARMEALSKGGETRTDGETEHLVDASAEDAE